VGSSREERHQVLARIAPRVFLTLPFIASLIASPRIGRADDPPPQNEVESIEVQVNAPSLLARGEADPTAFSSVLDRDDLDTPGASVTDLLIRLPSVQITRRGGDADLSTLSLRGASPAQTPVYLGLVRINDDFTGTADLSALPTFVLRRIEVYRGAAPAFLEDAGFGGAVLLDLVYPTKPAFSVGTTIGTLGERELTTAGAMGSDRGGVAISARLSRSDNDYTYIDDGGTRFSEADDRVVSRDNADHASVDVWGTAKIRLGSRSSLSTFVNGFSRAQGLTGLGLVPAREARGEMVRELASASLTTRCGDDPNAESCVIETSVFGKRTASSIDDPLLELPSPVRFQNTTSESGGLAARLSLTLIDLIGIEAGVMHKGERLAIDTPGSLGLRAFRDTARAYGTASMNILDIVEYAISGAVAVHRTRGPGPDVNYLAPATRIGVGAHPIDELSVMINGSYSLRVPTLAEAYGSSEIVKGNPLLRPERGVGADAGLRFESTSVANRLALEAVGFVRSAEDLIAYRRTSVGVLVPFNIGSALVAGGEFSAALRLFGSLDLESNLTLTHGRDTTEGSPFLDQSVPFLAPITSSSTARFDLARIIEAPSLPRFAFETTFSYRAARTVDPAGLVELGDQKLWDAAISWGIFRADSQLELRVANLLDDRTTDTVGYPVPGRALHLSLQTTIR
jgi:vitamin B12 transporter